MTRSLWLDIPHDPYPRLEGHEASDAIIVGAGMTGVGLAHFLAGRRLKTLVLEAETVAGGATGRNLGLLVSGLGEHYARSVEFWGRESAAAITRLNLANHDLLAEIIRSHNLDCEYERSGGFSVAADEGEEGELRRSSVLLQQDGFECVFLDAREVNRRLGGRGFFGAIYTPVDGYIHPVRLIRGLARAVEGRGIRIMERSPVRSIERAGQDWILRLVNGSATAPLIFLACNASLPMLRSSLPVQPVRGQCCAFQAPRCGLPDMACVTNYGAEYWRNSGDHFVFGGFRRLGGYAESDYRDDVTCVIQSALRDFVRAHFPALDDAPVSHRWSGTMAFTPDGLPLVGAITGDEGIYYAGGYTGHGFGYAFLAARWLANLALDGRDEIPHLCRIDRPMRPSPALAEL
jgi:glycine/D-amino acid oxidase-like deaminating enzyme